MIKTSTSLFIFFFIEIPQHQMQRNILYFILLTSYASRNNKSLQKKVTFHIRSSIMNINSINNLNKTPLCQVKPRWLTLVTVM